jgi:hypothetical protein
VTTEVASPRLPGLEQPERRPLKIFAFDPMRPDSPLGTLTAYVDNEEVAPGPAGQRLKVIDFDQTADRYYVPLDLNDPAVLIQGGLEPSESDPRFHQQMVYAVAMKVLENFDRALGRRLRFRKSKNRDDDRLLLLPHAFRGPNAFFDPKLQAVCFGYFTADEDSPGENLPGQTVFTCLSHDVIAHEVSHAIVHRLREFLLDATNVDVLAFHEGFSDIVAIFQHFTFHDVLKDAIQRTRGNLGSSTELVELASQFGHATGKGGALRSALEPGTPDPKRYESVMEPHERGSILVAAVFDAFFDTYQARIRDLVRIASGGTGVLPEGDLHPDLVDRLAREAARAAQSVLTMCIRAFEYLPPVDLTYSDYLRALVTADVDLIAEAGLDQRRAMIESFRQRGIYPRGVASLAQDSLVWPGFDKPDLEPMPAWALARRMLSGVQTLRGAGQEATERPDDSAARLLHAWAVRHASYLDLDPDRPIDVQGFHSTFRVAPNGQLQVEVVSQFLQMEKTEGRPEFGGLPLRGGATVVASAEGDVRFVISKPLDSPKIRSEKRAEAKARLEQQLEYVERCDRHDPALAWADDAYEARRMRMRADFRALHQGLHA